LTALLLVTESASIPFGAPRVLEDLLCCAEPGELGALPARISGSESKNKRQRCGKILEVTLLLMLGTTEARRGDWDRGFTAKTAANTERFLVEDYRAESARRSK
jgi:hypothetical protein